MADPTPTIPSHSVPPRWAAFALAGLALVAWSAAIVAGGSAFDDVEGVFQNPLINGTAALLDAFRFDYWHHLGDAGHYRPLTLLSLALDHFLFGSAPRGYHATSVLLHAVVVLFAALFARRALCARLAQAAFVGLALFAIHPALADAVAWISGRSSPLSLLPGVFFAWIYVAHGDRRPLFGLACVLGAAFLGVCAKEDGFFGALLVLSATWQAGPRARRAGALGLVIGLFGYFALRSAALGSPLPSAPFAPLAGAPLDVRLATAGGAMSAAARCLFWPIELAPSWQAATWPISWTAANALAGWSLWLALLGLALWWARRAPALATSLALAALAWVPVQQWLPAGELFALRFLYQPLFFLALPIGAALLTLVRQRAARVALGAALVVVLVPLAFRAARPYASRAAYARATLQRFPGDAQAWNGLGLAEEELGDTDAARGAFENALELDPTYGRPHSNLARLDLAAGATGSARRHFEAAVELGPGNPIAWCNLGSFELRASRPEEARAAYLQATRLTPGLLVAWRGLTRAEVARGDRPTARLALARALALDPRDPGCLALAQELAE